MLLPPLTDTPGTGGVPLMALPAPPGPAVGARVKAEEEPRAVALVVVSPTVASVFQSSPRA